MFRSVASFSIDFWNSYADEEFNFVRKNVGRMDYKTLDRVLGRKGYSDGSLGVLALRHKARVPSPYDVLACLTKDDPGTFHNFCGDFGYDEDSRRAEQTYHAVQEEWRKVQMFFASEELDKLREIN